MLGLLCPRKLFFHFLSFCLTMTYTFVKRLLMPELSSGIASPFLLIPSQISCYLGTLPFPENWMYLLDID